MCVCVCPSQSPNLALPALWISVTSLLSLGLCSFSKASIPRYCVSFLPPLPPVCVHLSLGLYPSLLGFLCFSPG